MAETRANPFDKLLREIPGLAGKKYYAFSELNDARVEKLPYSIRVLLECALRNCDEFNILSSDVEKILAWEVNSTKDIEIPFKPARVILQDFTGVPLVVDLAAMRDAIQRLGGNPNQINPACQVDLVIDHSIQVDHAKGADSLEKNEELEFYNNKERFEFLKWGQNAFENFRIVPPGSGIVHQVNLEYLARGVFTDKNGVVYPDSVVGTDSHTTMINGLGVLGWGVGGIEAESNMLGECSAMVLPEVVGFKLTGELPKTATATDLVLTCTQMLRKRGVVGKFVEFFGPGIRSLTLADRGTVANMAPEYGATTGFFPVDEQTINFLRQTGRTEEQIQAIEAYYKAQGLFRVYDGSQVDPVYSGALLELDLSTVVPSLAGPKRPMDRVALSDVKKEFSEGLTKPVTFKTFGVPQDKSDLAVEYTLNGEKQTFRHGQVLIAAITSCTNTSNPGVMLAAGILAKNAVLKGLSVPAYVKTSLSPGSQVVTKYYKEAGVSEYLDKLGFTLAGYGCMTCIGNSGDFVDPVLNQVVKDNDFVAAAVLSGNRNFEGRVHPQTRANYLASPPLVVAYALAGNVNFDFDTQALGKDQEGNDVFLRDIWPSREEVEAIAAKIITPEMFVENYSRIAKGTDRWNSLEVKQGIQYEWKNESTYIHNPPFFQTCGLELETVKNIENAYVLGNFGDSITTDHISPAGNIAKDSPAGRYLLERGVPQKDFNSYGARRGNDEVMARGTFANVRLVNKLLDGKVGPNTVHIPSGEVLSIFDAAAKYQAEGIPTVIFGGKEYGTGSSRDWAAKGPFLQGVKVVVAQSYERIHRSNLIGMGILPLEFKEGENADSLGLTGRERFSIDLQEGNLKVGQEVVVRSDNGKTFTTKCRLDTDVEVQYFKHGGILLFVLRKLASAK